MLGSRAVQAVREKLNVAAPPPLRAPAKKPPALVSSAALLQSRIGNGGMRRVAQDAREMAAPPARAERPPSASAHLLDAPVPAKPVAAAQPATPVRRSEGAPAEPSAAARPSRPAPTEVRPAPAAPTPAQASPSTAPAAAAAPPARAPRHEAKAAPAGACAAGRAPQPGGPEAQPAGAAPAAAPLAHLKSQVAHLARGQKQRPHVPTLVAQSHVAAVVPAPEGQSRAAAATLAGLDQAETEPFDVEGFKKALQERLRQAMPDGKTGADVQKALNHDTGAEVANAMRGELQASQIKAVGELPAAAAAPQDGARFQPERPPGLLPVPPGPRPGLPGPAGAVPERLPDAALDTQADRADADAQLASENLTQDQLKRSNEPSFIDAATTRDAAERHSAAGPPAVRAVEGRALGEARARAGALLSNGVAGLFGSRAAGFLTAFGLQDAARGREEAERAQVAGALDQIQRRTRADIEAALDRMERDAVALFDDGLKQALEVFDARREQLEEKLRRQAKQEARENYDVIGYVAAGWGDLDEYEVECTIRGARDWYNKAVDRAIERVAALVGPALAAVKKRIAAGKAEAAAYVAGLQGSAAEIGARELERIDAEFDQLGADVDARRDGLIQKLGESYAASQAEVEAHAQAFRDANKSWWQKLKEKVAGVIRAIIHLKDLFLSVLSKAAGVVGAILSDPIGFLGNLITGVKRGLSNFVANFLTHLKEGFFEWLFGQAGRAGIEVPKTWDAAGLFGLIASIVGLTYANVRARALAKLGPNVVGAIETGAGMLMVLREKGFAGLWEMLIEKLLTLKDSVIEQIQSMLLTEVIKAGITWLIGLLNPAAAFIKACKAIYEIVMFFVNNGERILALVDAVLDSIGAIAAGQLDAAANKVEGALARTIPVIIGFLAGLLGLGSIGDKVKAIVERIQAPVNKAIDWLIDKAAAGGKALFAAGKSVAKGVFGWARATVGFKDAENHSHTISIDEEGGRARLMVRSTPQGAREFVNAYAAHKKLAANDAKLVAALTAVQASQKKADDIEALTKAAAAQAQIDAALGQLLELNIAAGDAIRLLVSGNSIADLPEYKTVYKLEGLTGTYGSMPKVTSDKMTPDHQPQKSLLTKALALGCFPANGKLYDMAHDGKVAGGYAINLRHERHVKGRTYGNSVLGGQFDAYCASIPASTPVAQKRGLVIGRLKSELQQDVTAMRNIYDDPSNYQDVTDLKLSAADDKALKAEIATRVKSGLDEIKNQNLDALDK